MFFQNQPVIEIKNNTASALFSPEHGGRLLTWQVDGHEVIHWPEHVDWANARKIRGGNPLLFPFIARHLVDGELGWWLDDKGVKREMPMHGFAHSQPFASQVAADRTAISLTLEDNARTRSYYPFAFLFEARYRLDGNVMEVTLCTRNTGTQAMPYYPGHHFYFALPHGLRDETILHLPPSHRHTFLPNGDISPPETGNQSYRISDPCMQDRMHILKEQQEVRMVTPSLGRDISITLQVPGSIPWYAVTTWAENPEDDYFCVEPWAGLPNAIHHRQGLRWLQPGQQESVICRIAASFA